MSRRPAAGQVSLLRPAPDELLQLARQALALLTELAAHYEVARLGPPAQPLTIARPQDVADYLGPELADLAQEQLRVVLLNVKAHVVGAPLVYQGGVNAIEVRLADVFREAVRAGAASLILCHNHPTGDLTPSPEDVAVTGEAMRAGRLLGINVLDHIILGKGGRHVSLRERGLLPAAVTAPVAA